MKLFQYNLGLLLFLLCTAPASAQNNPEWQAPNPAAYSNSMTIISVVQFNGEFSGSTGDTVAFYIDGQLRGLAEPTVIPGLFGGVQHSETVFANGEQGAAIEIRVYHAATDMVYVLDQGLTFMNQAVVGNFSDPYRIRLADDTGDGVGTGTIMLAPIPEQSTVGETPFADLELIDFVNSISTGAVTYALANATAGVDFSLSGSTLMATPEGGFRGLASVDLTVMESANGHTDQQTLRYIVNDPVNDAQFIPVPDQIAEAGEQFDPLALEDFTDSDDNSGLEYGYLAMLPTGPEATRPELTQPTGFSNSMTVTASVQYTGSYQFGDPDDLLAAYVDGELRGVATATMILDQSLFFLSISTNAVPGENYTLEFYDGATGRSFDYPIEHPVQAGEQVGSFSDPNVYDFSPILIELEAATGNLTATRQDPSVSSRLDIEATLAGSQSPELTLDTAPIAFIANGFTLPVELQSFTGRRDAKVARLNWQVTGEDQFAGYTVERSAESTPGRFREVGWIAASQRSNYSFTDAAPLNGPSYYRLRMVDLDGATALSPVVYLPGDDVGSAVSLSVYPNPSGGRFFVEVAAESAVDITLRSSLGMEIARRRVTPVAGRVILELGETGLSAGVYLVDVEGVVQRVVVH